MNRASAPASLTQRLDLHSSKPRKNTSCTSRPPIALTALNISVWTCIAMSQVGWRLMVASIAKIRRPLPAVLGADELRTLARKASTSSRLDTSCAISRAASLGNGGLGGKTMAYSETGLAQYMVAPEIRECSFDICSRPEQTLRA